MISDIDIPITLKVGVTWRKGDSRYVVLRHVYGEKPRWKYVGPALRHKEADAIYKALGGTE